MSISSFIEYLQFEKNYSLHTVTAYKKDLLRFQEFCKENFNETNIDNVPYTYIRSWIVEMVDTGLINRTINRKISSLKTFYNFLIKTKQIKNNPLQNHKALKVAKKVTVPFTSDEINLVINALQEEVDFKNVRNKLIVELLYSTGMRRAELISLKNSDVDLSNQLVKVLGKRNKERYIPLLNSVCKTIEKYNELKEELEVKDDHFLITEKGKKTYPTLVYRIINEYFSNVSSKVKKSPHIIRHSFATHLINEGADLNSVKELLGHSSLASTQVYTHNSLNELKQLYNRAHPRSNKNY
ncbi:MAG: tyrosine-type recombinase/integrase [Bacteroidota bacterium]